MTTIGAARQAVAAAAARADYYRQWHAAMRMGATNPRIVDMIGPRPTSLQPFEAALIEFGEESGSLEQSLSALVAHFKAEHKLLLRIWSKLTYPLIVSLAFIVIGPVPLIFMGQTRTYLISVLGGLALWYGLGGGVIVGLAANYANRREFVLTRLARTIAAGIEAGLPLDRVVILAVQATAHPELTAHVKRFSARQLGTQSLSETFAGCPVIPPEMVAAIKVAEVSGDFSGALRKLADLYES